MYIGVFRAKVGIHVKTQRILWFIFSRPYVVYFFIALIKHEIRLKYEKCIVSVSHFMVCFTKYLQNAESTVLARPSSLQFLAVLTIQETPQGPKILL